MKIKIPTSARKKSLFIIDVQPQTLKNNASATLKKIREVVRATSYDFYVVATYHAETESMFYKQSKWHLPQASAGASDESLLAELSGKNAEIFYITKQTRSCFKSEQKQELVEKLKDKGISEIHLLGYEINDCVLATAYDAIDLGFYSYVIEEACNHDAGDAGVVAAAIKVLREQNMTNNSNLFDSGEIEISDS